MPLPFALAFRRDVPLPVHFESTEIPPSSDERQQCYYYRANRQPADALILARFALAPCTFVAAGLQKIYFKVLQFWPGRRPGLTFNKFVVA